MNNVTAVKTTASIVEDVLVKGDIAKLSESERVFYYKQVCESVGLNPLTKPFEYITLNGKLTLYAKRDATDQLRKKHAVSITKIETAKIDDIYIVTAYAKDGSGREDSATGAVFIGASRGDALANLYMKAETKAKRRVTLSICGLGMLDETEVETISHQGMDKAKEVEQKLIPNSDRANDYLLDEPIDLGDIKCEFGKKYLGKSLKEIGDDNLLNYVSWIESEAKKNNKNLTEGKVFEFVTAARAYLGGKQ